MSTHIIQRYTFDVQFDTQPRALALQERISRMFHAEVSAATARLMEQVVPEDLVAVLDVLQLDLGVVPFKDLETVIPARLLPALEEALRALLRNNSTSNDSRLRGKLQLKKGVERQLELLQYYLLHGVMPWWATLTERADPGLLLEELAAAVPGRLAVFLRQTAQYAYVRQRIVYQFRIASIQAAVQVLEPAEAVFIFAYAKEIMQLQQQQQIVATEGRELEKAVWLFVLTYLITEQSSSFNRKQFIHHNLVQMARHFNVSYELLLGLFYDAIAQSSPALSPVGIARYITLLYEDLSPAAPGIHRNAIAEQQGAAEQESLLRYYLRYGSLPWWAPPQRMQDLQQMITQMATRSPAQLKRLLHEVIPDKVARARWDTLFQPIQQQVTKEVHLWIGEAVMAALSPHARKMALLAGSVRDIPQLRHLGKDVLAAALRSAPILLQLQDDTIKQMVLSPTYTDEKRLVVWKALIRHIKEEGKDLRLSDAAYEFLMVRWEDMGLSDEEKIWLEEYVREEYVRGNNLSAATSGGATAAGLQGWMSRSGDAAAWLSSPAARAVALASGAEDADVLSSFTDNAVVSQAEDTVVLPADSAASQVESTESTPDAADIGLFIPPSSATGSAALPTASRNPLLRDVVLHLLTYGSMPWWSKRYAHLPLHRLLEELVLQQPAQALMVIRYAGSLPHAMTRFLTAVPSPLFFRVLRQNQITIADNRLFENVYTILLFLYRLVHADPLSLRTTLLAAYWQTLGAGDYRTFSKGDFLQAVLDKTAAGTGNSTGYLVFLLKMLLTSQGNNSVWRELLKELPVQPAAFFMQQQGKDLIQRLGNDLKQLGDHFTQQQSGDLKPGEQPGGFPPQQASAGAFTLPPADKYEPAVILRWLKHFMLHGLLPQEYGAGADGDNPVPVAQLLQWLYTYHTGLLPQLRTTTAPSSLLLQRLYEIQTQVPEAAAAVQALLQSWIQPDGRIPAFPQEEATVTPPLLWQLQRYETLTDHSERAALLDTAQELLHTFLTQQQLPAGMATDNAGHLTEMLRQATWVLHHAAPSVLDRLLRDGSHQQLKARMRVYSLFTGGVSAADQQVRAQLETYIAADSLQWLQENARQASTQTPAGFREALFFYRQQPVAARRAFYQRLLQYPAMVVKTADAMDDTLWSEITEDIPASWNSRPAAAITELQQLFTHLATDTTERELVQLLLRRFHLQLLGGQLTIHNSRDYVTRLLEYLAASGESTAMRFIGKLTDTTPYISALSFTHIRELLPELQSQATNYAKAHHLRESMYEKEAGQEYLKPGGASAISDTPSDVEQVSSQPGGPAGNIQGASGSQTGLQDNSQQRLSVSDIQSEQEDKHTTASSTQQMSTTGGQGASGTQGYTPVTGAQGVPGSQQRMDANDVQGTSGTQASTQQGTEANDAEGVSGTQPGAQQQTNANDAQGTSGTQPRAQQQTKASDAQGASGTQPGVQQQTKANDAQGASGAQQHTKASDTQETPGAQPPAPAANTQVPPPYPVPPPAPTPTTQPPEWAKVKKPPLDTIYVSNAGLILLHPFLPFGFAQLGLLDNSQFTDSAAAHRAIHLLQYMVTGQETHAEHDLALNKILCNVPLEEPVPVSIVLTEKEKQLCGELLRVLLQRWEKMQHTSVEGFQAAFLRRDGALWQAEGEWWLKVEERGYDAILQTLPWGIGMIRAPWMEKTLYTEWVYI